MSFDNWPLSKRALTLNVACLAGVGIGFASSEVKLSPTFCVPIAVFTFALLNFLILAVRPKIVLERAAGRRVRILQALVGVVDERPLVFLLIINQLIGTSALLIPATILLQLLIGGGIHNLPNASRINVRMIPVSVSLLAAVAAVWILSGVGLWRGRSWAWWLTMFLNGLAVIVSLGADLLGLLVLKQHRPSFGWREIAATVACLVLLLPVVRNEFRRVRTETECI